MNAYCEGDPDLELLEFEVLDLLASMAELVDPPAPTIGHGSTSFHRIVGPKHNPSYRRPCLSFGSRQQKRRRTLAFEIHSNAPDPKKLVPFPPSKEFRGVKANASYVSLLNGRYEWKKPVQ